MRAVLAALALVISVAACSDITGPGSTGTYDLETVNGRSLPFVVRSEIGYRLELTRSTLTLERDGSYTSTFTWRETENGQSFTDTERYSGTYERRGDDLWLYDDFDGSTTEAYWQGNRLVVLGEGVTYEYR
ncbi:MAG TPA: hypothetical protein VEA99_10650 [Gemmatimonadaceae bacterium]|nr:hypothetical protein [Gemmatimonadaceae bacterium]